MRYVTARAINKSRERAYRIYVTDALKFIASNTANYGGGMYPTSSWIDTVEPRPEDRRTYQEITDHVISKVWGNK